MGYFSNGTEGDLYEEQYCSKCVHQDDESGCPVMLAHMLHNYKECNNEDSILHLLIPRGKDGFNEECKLFIPAKGGIRIIDTSGNPELREWAKRHGAL